MNNDTSFQIENQPLNTNINGMLQSILSNYRYNHSNWLYMPGAHDDTYKAARKQGEFFLTTNTKRFMVLLTRFATGPDYSTTPSDDRKTLPVYEVKVNCFIPGDYHHDVVQKSANGYIELLDGNSIADDKYKIMYYSYVIFDFTPTESKNGVSVTDQYGVPIKGIFTLELVDSSKATTLPYSTNIRFTMIGSGIDTAGFAPLIPGYQVNSSFFKVVNDAMRGSMIGYGNKVENSFELDNGEAYPLTQYIPQNILLPFIPNTLVSSNLTGYDMSIEYTFNEEGLTMDNILYDDLSHILLPYTETYNELDIKLQVNDTHNTVASSLLTSRRGYKIAYIKTPVKGSKLTLTQILNSTCSLKSNNLLVVQPINRLFNKIDVARGGITMVLPQTDQNITNNIILDDELVNYINSLYKYWNQPKDYKVGCYYSSINSLLTGYSVVESPINCLMQCDDTDVDSYDIVCENWNNDTAHNIYIKFII